MRGCVMIGCVMRGRCDWVYYERVCGRIGDSSVVNTRMESLRQIYDTSVCVG